ncbi:hypothetical protein MPH_07268 [Macrophomina phaseolina MS6]|uniref:Uncharacterized protein n=1 Tax=Macrophomina phaseolina (strain MS6) TaxID=1126212 RepID=K2RLH8_MACPH|nr:hypothetical protein MPH_07268 [Macrophomina phaseolina MS6]
MAAVAARQTALNGPYTLTAYAPGNVTLNGAKAQNGGNLFGPTVASYCPTVVTSCPNGTDTAYAGTLYPLAEVPGGQDLYVTNDGQIRITVQHSHSIPPGAYWNYQGWSWNALPASDTPVAAGCPESDPRYDCAAPTGYWTFHAPDAPEGVCGVVACPSEYSPDAVSAYAVTPNFTRTDCTPILGLATHGYSGPNPPVWSYL